MDSESNRHAIVVADVSELTSAVREAQPQTTIRLRAGDYELWRPLVIRQSLTIEGEGTDACRLLCDDREAVVQLEGSNEWCMSNVTLEHTGAKWASVLVVKGGSARLNECCFKGGRGELPQGAGIWIQGDSHCIVTRCAFFLNSKGIGVYGEAHALLRNNFCCGNRDSGIAFYDDSTGTASGNECCENKHSGIEVHSHATPILEANNCNRNGGAGIAYFGDAAGIARQNKCLENGFVGIGVTGYARPVLEENCCNTNGSGGIAFKKKSSGIARANECGYNGQYAIKVDSTANPALTDNRSPNGESAPIFNEPQRERPRWFTEENAIQPITPASTADANTVTSLPEEASSAESAPVKSTPTELPPLQSPLESSTWPELASPSKPLPKPPPKKGRRIHDLDEFQELWPAVLIRMKRKIGVTAVAYLHDAKPIAFTDDEAVLEFPKEFSYVKACEAATRLPFEQIINECLVSPRRLVFRWAGDGFDADNLFADTAY